MELLSVNTADLERRDVLLPRVTGTETEILICFCVFLVHITRRTSEFRVLACETDSCWQFD